MHQQDTPGSNKKDPTENMEGSQQPQIVHLNVGGQRFSTSKSTLSWIPDTFFSSLLSGRIASVADDNGAIFIDRDPELFRRILNYLRTKQVDLNGVSLSMLKHEAEFYEVSSTFQRISNAPITMKMAGNSASSASNGSYGYASKDNPALNKESVAGGVGALSYCSSGSSSSSSNASAILNKFKMATAPLSGQIGAASSSFSLQNFPQPSIYGQIGRESSSPSPTVNSSKKLVVETDAFPSTPTDYKQFNHTNNTSNNSSTEQPPSNSPPFGSPYKTHSKKTRLTHNSVAVAYYNYVCCYRMKDSMGWQPIYVSPRMEYPIGHIALVSKFGGGSSQVAEKMLAIALTNNSVHLWCLDENNEAESNRKIGTFSLSVQIDKLFLLATN
uniref:BTB domain-containing protein n=1 Tax=Ditylenchus dipsaci TaxID=166011 RepID=A0A915EAN8_9BILA